MLESADFSKGCNRPTPTLIPLPTSLRYEKIFFTITDLYFLIIHAVSFSLITVRFLCNANTCRVSTLYSTNSASIKHKLGLLNIFVSAKRLPF